MWYIFLSKVLCNQIEMSDSDSDSDLAWSVCDPKDNLNCYRSPVANFEPECTECTEQALVRLVPTQRLQSKS